METDKEYVKTRNQKAVSALGSNESKESERKSPIRAPTLLYALPCQNVGNCGGWPKCKLGHVDPKMNKPLELLIEIEEEPSPKQEVNLTPEKQENEKEKANKSKCNMMIEKEIKSNNFVKYTKLDKMQMKAIYYILWTRYYEETPEYIDVYWEGNMEYEKIKDIPDDVLEKEDQIKVDYHDKEEKILVMCLDVKAKTFSVKGKRWSKWEQV